MINFRSLSIGAGLLSLLALTSPALAQTNLIVNPGLEKLNSSNMPIGWSDVWSRRPGAASGSTDSQFARTGLRSFRVVSTGTGDWSFSQMNSIGVMPGEIYQIAGWVACKDVVTAQLGVTTRDVSGNAIEWIAGEVDTHGTHGWDRISSRLLIPKNCATMQFRLTGVGSGTTWLDDVSVEKVGDIDSLKKNWNGRIYHMANSLLKVDFNPSSATMAVMDRRTGHAWSQVVDSQGAIVQSIVQPSPLELRLSLVDALGGEKYTATLTLPDDEPELRVTVAGTASLSSNILFPQPFATRAGDNLVMPTNEGMLYPADDTSVGTFDVATFNGHGGLSMPWAGVAHSDGSGVMLLVRTPDDAQVDMQRNGKGLLFLRPEWLASRGQIRYPRKLTYVFFAQGGYVAQAKWYREYAKATGLFVTLAEKRKANPNVDKLIGAVDVWAWIGPNEPIAICNEMKSLGMTHILWSNGGSPKQIAGINATGFLTGRYDCYQDLYPPDSGMMLASAKWPDDQEQQPDGSMTLGWLMDQQRNGVDVKVQAGVCNSKRAVEIAKIDIPANLKTTKFTARFLDTDTASPWREDYNPLHPLNRTQDRIYRMQLLALCSKDLKLVTGSETGIDPAVPYLDYFEGMMSIAQYRCPDSGTNPNAIIDPTPDTLKYQVGPKYRIPLFELVYHDCVVDYWYWGDFTNKMPAVWRRRDLFNILYATPPEFSFDDATWTKNEARFAQTYKDVCPLVRRLGYQEMLSHAFLTSDHTVQQTRWSDGTVVTINLGEKQYALASGQTVSPLGWNVSNSKAAVSYNAPRSIRPD